jgi:hypothetical protein
MKKLALLFFALFLIASCSMEEEDNVKFHIEFVPVVSVDLPEHFVRGETYEMKVKYHRPDDCHYFNGFYYDSQPSSNQRVVAVQTIVIEDANCLPVDEQDLEEVSFDFLCSQSYNNTSYVFKFYTGDDANGNQQYLEVEVPVLE